MRRQTPAPRSADLLLKVLCDHLKHYIFVSPTFSLHLPSLLCRPMSVLSPFGPSRTRDRVFEVELSLLLEDLALDGAFVIIGALLRRTGKVESHFKIRACHYHRRARALPTTCRFISLGRSQEPYDLLIEAYFRQSRCIEGVIQDRELRSVERALDKRYTPRWRLRDVRHRLSITGPLLA